MGNWHSFKNLLSLSLVATIVTLGSSVLCHAVGYCQCVIWIAEWRYLVSRIRSYGGIDTKINGFPIHMSIKIQRASC